MAGSFWDFVPALITAGATVYGVKQASKSSDAAAKQMTDATKAGTDATLHGLDMAKKELDINRTAASPGLMATQALISRGSALTPQQEMAVADSRDQALNALKGSSLRGSARATSAIVSDTDQRVRNAFMDQNQNRADSAATGLASQYFGAGNMMSNNATQAGNAVSQGLLNTGAINSANTMGQGTLRGQAIGDIGAVIADQVKESIRKDRDSSYQKVGG